MLTPFPCSSPHGEDRLCELLARYWRRQHPAFLYHPGGDLAKWGPHVMPPRQPFLGQGSKRGNAAAGRGRKGETGRAARAETGKQGISAGTTAPDRGASITLPLLPSWGPPTPHVCRFGSYLRSICLSEAEAWTCKSSGCPQHPHGTIGTPT